MERTGEILIVLEAIEVGQHAFPIPSVSAERLPFIVIIRQAAHRHHSVNARSTAHDARLLKDATRARAAIGTSRTDLCMQIGPEEPRIAVGSRITVANARRFPARRNIPARFQQKDSYTRVFRQPACEYAAGAAGSDDDHINSVGAHGTDDRWMRSGEASVMSATPSIASVCANSPLRIWIARAMPERPPTIAPYKAARPIKQNEAPRQ